MWHLCFNCRTPPARSVLVAEREAAEADRKLCYPHHFVLKIHSHGQTCGQIHTHATSFIKAVAVLEGLAIIYTSKRLFTPNIDINWVIRSQADSSKYISSHVAKTCICHTHLKWLDLTSLLYMQINTLDVSYVGRPSVLPGTHSCKRCKKNAPIFSSLLRVGHVQCQIRHSWGNGSA